MKFTKLADLVQQAAQGMEDARARRGRPPMPDVTEWYVAVVEHAEGLQQLLLRQPAGTVFLLLAVTCLGQVAGGRRFDLLDVYCRVSDLAETMQGAMAMLLGQALLSDHLRDGLEMAADEGIDLDRWPGR
jgi:hypothetical protein